LLSLVLFIGATLSFSLLFGLLLLPLPLPLLLGLLPLSLLRCLLHPRTTSDLFSTTTSTTTIIGFLGV
jgi:hypothetical protein